MTWYKSKYDDEIDTLLRLNERMIYLHRRRKESIKAHQSFIDSMDGHVKEVEKQITECYKKEKWERFKTYTNTSCYQYK